MIGKKADLIHREGHWGQFDGRRLDLTSSIKTLLVEASTKVRFLPNR